MQPMDKQQQIERSRAEFARLMGELAGKDESALTATAIDEWSVREVLAHIAGWLLLDADIMRRLARGERPLPEGEDRGSGDTRNPGYALADAAKSAATVIDELRAAFNEFITAAEAVPEERFADGRTSQRIMQGNGFAHVNEHREQIEAFFSTRAGR